MTEAELKANAINHESILLGSPIEPLDFKVMKGGYVLTYQHSKTLRFAVFNSKGQAHTSGILEQG